MVRRPIARAGKLVLALGAVMIVAVGTVMAASSSPMSDPTADEDRVLFALTGAFANESCLSLQDAAKRVREHLDASGFDAWSVSWSARLEDSACVTAAVAAADSEVVLIPTAVNLAAANERILASLTAGCLNEDEARDLVVEVLATLGVTSYSIRTDGPIAYPSGQRELVAGRLAAGCVIFSGSGSDARGLPVIYLSGNS